MVFSVHSPIRLSRNEPGLPLLKGSRIIRGDSIPLRLMVVEEGQDAATTSFRFVAKIAEDHPNGVPLITKVATDFTVTVTGSVLQADFEILPAETSFFTDQTTLIYDLERKVGTRVKTLEQGQFSIIPDVAV